jgi:ankyrin repeat protein
MGHADIAKALVRAGCDTTLRAKKGETGREVAMQHDHTAVVRAIDAAVASVAAGEPQPEPAHASAELSAGTAVTIEGLVGASQHNGKFGVVEGFDAAKGRYVVRVIGEVAITINLKPANLQRLPGGFAGAALVMAAGHGDVAAMGRLLDGGADPNALVQSDRDDPARPGRKLQTTAMIMALDCQQEAAARLLLERGADPSLMDSRGVTPLMAAAVAGSLAWVRLLLARRVALDCVVPNSGATAFHYACLNGHADVAVALVQARCNTTLRDKNGATGRQVAMQRGHAAVVQAIDTAAASVTTVEPQPEPEHAPAELAAGTAVEIDGLVGAPQHNGK